MADLVSTPLHGLVIPIGLLLVGTALTKIEWIWYSVGLSIVLGAFKIYRGRKSMVSTL